MEGVPGIRRSPAEALQSLRIDKDAPTPAYVQIAEALGKLLKSGELPAGYPLPPERALCDRFGVSRMTYRAAVGMLERQGLILSFRGRGTFVAHDRLRKAQDELRSFTEEILARGGVPESRVLSFRLVPAAEETREFFSLAEGEQAYDIRRLRLKDGTPLAIEAVQIPQRLCPGLDRFDLARNSLYKTLGQFYGMRLKTCVEEISAEVPSREYRRLLELPGGVAILVIRRKSYTKTGDPCELGRTSYRGDMYSAVVHSARRERE